MKKILGEELFNQYLHITPFILLMTISLQIPADFDLSPLEEKNDPAWLL